MDSATKFPFEIRDAVMQRTRMDAPFGTSFLDLSCTVTGSGEDSSLKRCGSKVATRCKLSMEMASFRADCWPRSMCNWMLIGTIILVTESLG